MKRICLSGVVLTGIAVTLCGCSSLNIFKKQDTEYLSSTITPPLRVPVGLNQAGVGNDYLIPAPVNTGTMQPNLIPPGSMAEKYANCQITKDDMKRITKFVKAPNPIANAAPVPTSAAPVTAETTKANVPAGITLAGGVPVLPLNQSSAQAWNTVGKGLKRAGYKIAYQDEKANSYYILDIFATDGKVTKATPIYLIKLEDSSAGNGYAYVLDQMAGPVKPEVAETVLEKLKDGIAGKGPSFFSTMFSPVKRWFTEAF